jgi:predicted nucleic acid-binding protein
MRRFFIQPRRWLNSSRFSRGESLRDTRYTTAAEIAEFVTWLVVTSELIAVNREALGSCDRDDNGLLALAIVGKADFLVTGDKDLLALRQIENVLSPAGFLAALHHHGG